MHFLCPKCRERLEKTNGSAVCKNGHSYDRSKYGYYNLLVGGGAHGDNREMVRARRDFLALGYYRPLALSVSELLLKYTPKGGSVIDTGCGEGYYTDLFERALTERDGISDVCAFDISKDAVGLCAKRNKAVSTAVFGSYHMPISDGEFSSAINMFSPNAKDEIHRVLKDKGIYIMAIPAEEHLFALKAAIYKTPYKNEVQDTALDGFVLKEQRRVSYEMRLKTREEIRSLFAMTPYAYRTRPEDGNNINLLDSLSVMADFLVLVYEKV